MTTHYVAPNTSVTGCCHVPWRTLPDSDYITQSEESANCKVLTPPPWCTIHDESHPSCIGPPPGYTDW